MAEPRIVQILRAHGGWMPSGQMLDRYCAEGAARGTAYGAVCAARRNGWIERRGRWNDFEYRIHPDAPAHIRGCSGGGIPRARRESTPSPEDIRASDAAAAALRLPARDRGPLLATLGPPHGDPEVMPPEVGRLIDNLHRHFDEVFMRVE